MYIIMRTTDTSKDHCKEIDHVYGTLRKILIIIWEKSWKHQGKGFENFTLCEEGLLFDVSSSLLVFNKVLMHSVCVP